MDVLQPAVQAEKPESITDKQFFSALECMEAYLVAQEELAAALKAGLFDIAKGKYSLGPGALGQQCYPGDMQAAAVVQLTDPPEQPGSLFEHFHLSQSQQQCHAATAAAAAHLQQPQQPSKQAGNKAGSEQQAQQNSTSHSKCGSSSSNGREGSSHVDPLSWFSALPPAPLKSAQLHFATALQRAVAAANRVQQLRHLLDELQGVTEEESP